MMERAKTQGRKRQTRDHSQEVKYRKILLKCETETEERSLENFLKKKNVIILQYSLNFFPRSQIEKGILFE